MKRCLAWLIIITLTFGGCANYSIKTTDGSSVAGSMLNGAVSYSSGPACVPAVPSPASPIPSPPITAMAPKLVCDSTGKNCRAMLIQLDTPTPQCNTQVVNVRGTDVTTYFAMLAGALGLGILASHAL